MKKVIFILGLSFLMMFSINSQAQQKHDKRQVSQQVRIAHGVKNGELTRNERKALKKQQRHIRRTERRVQADGEITSREKAKLNRKQNRANRNIRRAKNNSRTKKG